MPLFNIVREREISRAEEIAILHQRGTSIEKLSMDLLYDRQWCKEQGIRYYDLKTSCECISAWEMAKNFVINSVFNRTYVKNT